MDFLETECSQEWNTCPLEVPVGAHGWQDSVGGEGSCLDVECVGRTPTGGNPEWWTWGQNMQQLQRMLGTWLYCPLMWEKPRSTWEGVGVRELGKRQIWEVWLPVDLVSFSETPVHFWRSDDGGSFSPFNFLIKISFHLSQFIFRVWWMDWAR